MAARRSIFALVFILVLACVALGCGEDSNDSSSPSSIPKSDFVAQANAICKRGNEKLVREIVAYQKKNLNEFSVKVVSGAARTVIKPELETQINQIRNLGTPSGGADEVEQFFVSLIDGVDEIATERPPTFNEAETMLRDASDIARRYGIAECEYTLVDKEFAKRVLKSD